MGLPKKNHIPIVGVNLLVNPLPMGGFDKINASGFGKIFFKKAI
jgi:hypothetical protein